MRLVFDSNGKKLLTEFDFIGKGEEAKVYHKGDVAYKCYHHIAWCSRLLPEDVSFLQGIYTDCILLPQTTLYNIFGDFCGYTTRYIEDLGLLHFMGVPTNVVLRNFKLLSNDARVLGENRVLVSDFMPKDTRVRNYSFNEGLYFVDPGKYFINYDSEREKIVKRNKDLIDNFLFFRVLNKFCKEQFGDYGYDFSKLYSSLSEARDNDVSFLEYIACDIKEDNLEDYVKRKVL